MILRNTGDVARLFSLSGRQLQSCADFSEVSDSVSHSGYRLSRQIRSLFVRASFYLIFLNKILFVIHIIFVRYALNGLK